MMSSAIEDLFARTLTGDYEDEIPWDAVRALRRLGTRDVLDKARPGVGPAIRCSVLAAPTFWLSSVRRLIIL